VAIESYGNAKYEWLQSFLELPNGIPSHDTFSRVFARIEPQQFQECFLSWINAIVGELELNVIAIDGKTMKQSYDRNDQQKALHIVTAWSSFHQLVLGQKKVAKKSNELTAIPALIEMLEIAGSVITIDARLMSKRHNISDCQKKRRLYFSFKRASKTPVQSRKRMV
jgi:hypothetical protein